MNGKVAKVVSFILKNQKCYEEIRLINNALSDTVLSVVLKNFKAIQQ